MTSEEEKMLAGTLYRADDAGLVAKRGRARLLLARFTGGDKAVLEDLLGAVGSGVEIVPPFFCDYGANIFVGSRVFVNTGCVILDCARVDIGDDVLFGPGVHLYTATHPLDATLRRSGLEQAAPVSIGADVWLGGQVVVCAGTSIGEGAVIGAGSVVTRDVPPGVVAAGNPCRVIRTIEAGRGTAAGTRQAPDPPPAAG